MESPVIVCKYGLRLSILFGDGIHSEHCVIKNSQNSYDLYWYTRGTLKNVEMEMKEFEE